MRKLIVASGNKGKIAEIKRILGGLFDVISMLEAGIKCEVEETGATFEENAAIKAKAVYKLCKGEFTLADDSGICVEALGGAPGIYSARYCGRHGDDEANNRLLLENLKDKANRSAYFYAAVALAGKNGECIIGRGRTDGSIMHAPEGEGGFGYDPLFYSFDLKKSFGVATAEEKNSVSHRARALKDLLEKIKNENL